MLDFDTPQKPKQAAPAGALRKAALKKRHEALKMERSSWLARWREIADHLRPGALRDNRGDVNKGDNRHGKIINFTPLEAVRTLASGMMAGVTSPSRPWFRLTIAGETELVQAPGVKEWLSACEKVLREDMARSNFYKELHRLYLDLGPFGTVPLLLDEDTEDGVRAYVVPAGSYCLATSPRGDVDTLFREVSYTVAQLAKDFGLEACSESVQRLHADGQLDVRVEVTHAILPNDTMREGALGPDGKPWLSAWWEAAAPADTGFLRVAGYYERPFMCPRWEQVGEDVYGRGPGFAALGDCKALQLLERRSAQATDKVVSPPMAAPTAAQHQAMSLVPGGVSFVDGLGAGAAVRPAFEVPYQAVEVFEMKVQRHEMRVRKAFFADLWLLLSESTGQMTAREVQERREEKLLQLGTVLEALNDELLDPAVDRFFGIALRQGRLPPPPEELQGRELKTEYISIMAQAQKLLAVTGLERIATFVGNLSSLRPEVLDKLDLDKLVNELADALGVPPGIIRADEAVEALRQARAQQQQQAQQVAAAGEAAKAAKSLGDTDMSGPNGLTELLRAAGVR